MENQNQQTDTSDITEEVILRKRARISPFWLLPLVAIFIAGWLLFQYWVDKGTEITIEFSSAPGVVANRTPIRYQGVEVGMVQSVTISKDLKSIIVTASINKDMRSALTSGTKFWLVTPKASLAGVSGLDALVGGNYIGMLPNEGNEQSQFIAQDTPPQLNIDDGELLIYLTAKDLGSLNENSAIYYRKVPVGYISDYSVLPNDKGVSIAAVIKKRYANLVREKSQFWNVSGVEGDFNLNSGASIKMESLSAVINGAVSFDSPADSLPAQEGQQFVLQSTKQDVKQLEQQGKETLHLSLWAQDTYGVNSEQPIVYRGIKIGEVLQRHLSDEKVNFDIAIFDEYRYLITRDSKFVANSRVDLQLGLNGIQFQGATPQEWLDGGIHLLPGKDIEKGKKALPENFPLYRSDENAKSGILGSAPPTTIKLNATSLPDIQTGSVVLYRQFAVGKIIAIKPTDKGFEVNIHISSQYRHLLTDKSVFWAEGGAKVQLNGNGLTVQAAPLSRAISGAISFDNLQSGSPDSVRQHTLFPTETSAKAIGSAVTLTTFDASKLSEGMPIRYLGINIGQIESLKLSADNREVKAKAILYPEYVEAFTKIGSRFAVVTPELSPSGVNNLDTLLQPYISAEPGRDNKNRYQFELQTANITDSRYLDGLTIYLDASEAGSIQVGTPILFRGLEIGTVTGLYLGELSDRVYVATRIGKEYQYLVRDNTQFWLSSGYNLAFGLTGGVIKSGTFKQFVRGGISLATPPTVPLSPKAKAEQHFILKLEPPSDWLDWGTSIPKK
ncbi:MULTISPECIES: PqiB family protein [Providencia]|uniref:Paraquat-inducible protein B n=1 Tax=Providencia heimbachae ATCC 35613 TaxID=1354272 RepID=A0A1B7K4K8_9GAMM|nr:MlaD family protein [Providencia heimbachae]MBP6121394.1 MCE family protein [Providencia sp.]NIH22582.1 MCE family protein [Providencia heimbachae]OAT54954.1 paraquat-inducible protein B [Providencia heimbachae ATCC 35613]QCJ69944.1 MCE family protein [Providencia heimbachae]SQH13140.1 paraquat-inducible protein B [Providencia heimbachae]